MRHALVPWGNLNCIKICNTTLVTRVHSTHLYQIKNSPLWKLQNSHRTKILVTPLNGSVKEKNPQRYIKSFFFSRKLIPHIWTLHYLSSLLLLWMTKTPAVSGLAIMFSPMVEESQIMKVNLFTQAQLMGMLHYLPCSEQNVYIIFLCWPGLTCWFLYSWDSIIFVSSTYSYIYVYV